MEYPSSEEIETTETMTGDIKTEPIEKIQIDSMVQEKNSVIQEDIFSNFKTKAVVTYDVFNETKMEYPSQEGKGSFEEGIQINSHVEAKNNFDIHEDIGSDGKIQSIDSEQSFGEINKESPPQNIDSYEKESRRKYRNNYYCLRCNKCIRGKSSKRWTHPRTLRSNAAHVSEWLKDEGKCFTEDYIRESYFCNPCYCKFQVKYKGTSRSQDMFKCEGIFSEPTETSSGDLGAASYANPQRTEVKYEETITPTHEMKCEGESTSTHRFKWEGLTNLTPETSSGHGGPREFSSLGSQNTMEPISVYPKYEGIITHSHSVNCEGAPTSTHKVKSPELPSSSPETSSGHIGQSSKGFINRYPKYEGSITANHVVNCEGASTSIDNFTCEGLLSSPELHAYHEGLASSSEDRASSLAPHLSSSSPSPSGGHECLVDYTKPQACEATAYEHLMQIVDSQFKYDCFENTGESFP